jgi:hypothetical protein
MADDVVPIRKLKVIGQAGGPVDEVRAYLVLQRDDLDPDVVSARLGCPPTRSPKGTWLLIVEGFAPTQPDQLLVTLLERFPTDPQFWADLRRDYEVRIDLAIHTGGWNRGFSLRPETVARVALTGVPFGFDLYFYGEEED